MAKKEEAIHRRGELFVELEELKGTPEVEELERRLEAIDSEILFRDEECRKEMMREGKEEEVGEEIRIKLKDLDQAGEICKVFLKPFN